MIFKEADRARVLGLGCFAVLMLIMCVQGSAKMPPPAVFDPGDFVETITNPYFPLYPGEVFIYSGVTDEGPEVLQIYVSHQKKTILGVDCAVVNETVTVDGILVEVAINWYAQDKKGNVWYFGEDSKEYQDGVVSGTGGSWEAGINGAVQGIIMEAHPRIGDVYQQEVAPGVATDMAQVLSKTRSIKVPYGNFNDCLFTKEWSDLEPGVTEYKYYVRGVGFALGITGENQRLVLRSIFHMPMPAED
jgi:hypothetical protein